VNEGLWPNVKLSTTADDRHDPERLLTGGFILQHFGKARLTRTSLNAAVAVDVLPRINTSGARLADALDLRAALVGHDTAPRQEISIRWPRSHSSSGTTPARLPLIMD
jgi:hypothetical protein